MPFHLHPPLEECLHVFLILLFLFIYSQFNSWSHTSFCFQLVAVLAAILVGLWGYVVLFNGSAIGRVNSDWDAKYGQFLIK